MASTPDFIEYVCERIQQTGSIRYRKMFGEYMIYINEKPILLVCDNTAYVKHLDCIRDQMLHASTGIPYSGAREHYILDIDDAPLCLEVLTILESVTPVPKPRKKK